MPEKIGQLYIEVVSGAEYHFRYKNEPICKNRIGNTYDEWACLRTALIQLLSKYGAFNPLGYGDGCFTVGEDWFEEKVFHVVVMSRQSYTKHFIQDCFRFVQEHNEVLITVAVSFIPLGEPSLDVILTLKRRYAAFHKKSRNQALDMINSLGEYAAAQELFI
jgi:hypothetical protein